MLLWPIQHIYLAWKERVSNCRLTLLHNVQTPSQTRPCWSVELGTIHHRIINTQQTISVDTWHFVICVPGLRAAAFAEHISPRKTIGKSASGLEWGVCCVSVSALECEHWQHWILSYRELQHPHTKYTPFCPLLPPSTNPSACFWSPVSATRSERSRTLSVDTYIYLWLSLAV